MIRPNPSPRYPCLGPTGACHDPLARGGSTSMNCPSIGIEDWDEPQGILRHVESDVMCEVDGNEVSMSETGSSDQIVQMGTLAQTRSLKLAPSRALQFTYADLRS